MAGKSLLPEAVESYVQDVVTRATPAQQRLRAETAAMPRAQMQISADQGAFLASLALALGVRRTLEVGTFTGYSALSVARVLPDDGRVVACDVSEEWTRVARRHWAEAGVAHKIDLRLGPAEATLDALLAAGEAGTYDLAFIDADKTGYDAYYERCLRLLRPRGVVLLDNMLWSGEVCGPPSDDPDTRALQLLNLKVRDDARVEACLLTVGDGLVMATKR